MTPFSCQIGVPFSANEMYAPIGRGQLVKTRAYRLWIEKNKPLIKEGLGVPERYPIVVNITIMGGRGWSMSRDVDNVCKPIIDLLCVSGVIPDDNSRYIERVTARYLHSPGRASEALTIISYEIPEEASSEWELPSWAK